jgi:hypothetical protein
MSLSYEKLDCITVRDPRTLVLNKREYAVLKSGSRTNWKPFTTNSISSSNISFTCPPPSAQFYTDRKQYFLLPIRLSFTGTAPTGQLLLNPGQDCPRAFPISSAIDSLQVTINNEGVSIQMADVIQALMHFNTDEKLSELDYSMTPNLLDQAQQYSSLFGTNRSPMAFYGDTTDKAMSSRTAFPFTVVSNTNTTAVVDMLCCEPLFLSPFYWGCGNESGFFNVSTMDFNITFLNQAGNRMWSHDAVSVGVPTTITNVQATFNNFSPAFSYAVNQPFMLFQHISPQENMIIPYNIPITYPYFEVIRFNTDSGNSIAAGGFWNFTSNNIQLSNIPRRVYVYVRERNADLYSTCQNPDTYFSLEAPFNLQWENESNLFSSATKHDLYKMSKKNHCNLSWTQWSGGPVMGQNSFATGDQYGTVGSILCFEYATDVGLPSLDAPGKLKQATFSVNGIAKNISNRTITPSVYVVVVYEGTFTITGQGLATTNLGVITSEDILNAQQAPFVNYCDIEDVNGGNFLSGLKSFGNKILNAGKDVNSFLRENKLISGISGAIPIPQLQGVSAIAKTLGYGQGGCGCCGGCGCMACRGTGVSVGGEDDDMYGSGSYGGARLRRKSLRRRLR